jgi:hypothetical protein
MAWHGMAWHGEGKNDGFLKILKIAPTVEDKKVRGVVKVWSGWAGRKGTDWGWNEWNVY